MQNIKITSCAATSTAFQSFGGGVATMGYNLTMLGCSVTFCTVQATSDFPWGGGIYISGGIVSCNGVLIAACISTSPLDQSQYNPQPFTFDSYGGGMAIASGSMELFGCAIELCDAVYGAGLAVEGVATVILHQTALRNNVGMAIHTSADATPYVSSVTKTHPL